MIKGSNTVVYFTHDYLANVPDKNTQLLDTVEICKNYNIKNVVAVSPLEYVNYYDSDGSKEDVITQENKAHEEAL